MTAAASWTNRPEVVPGRLPMRKSVGRRQAAPERRSGRKALERVRPILEAEGIFPVAMIDADLSRLEIPQKSL